MSKGLDSVTTESKILKEIINADEQVPFLNGLDNSLKLKLTDTPSKVSLLTEYSSFLCKDNSAKCKNSKTAIESSHSTIKNSCTSSNTPNNENDDPSSVGFAPPSETSSVVTSVVQSPSDKPSARSTTIENNKSPKNYDHQQFKYQQILPATPENQTSHPKCQHSILLSKYNEESLSDPQSLDYSKPTPKLSWTKNQHLEVQNSQQLENHNSVDPVVTPAVAVSSNSPMAKSSGNKPQGRPRKHNVNEEVSKPFVCTHTDCTWAFTKMSGLQRHLKSHDRRTFDCPFWKYDPKCHKNNGTFSRLDILKKHLKTNHFFQYKNSTAGRCRTCQQYFEGVKVFYDHCAQCAETPRDDRLIHMNMLKDGIYNSGQLKQASVISSTEENFVHVLPQASTDLEIQNDDSLQSLKALIQRSSTKPEIVEHSAEIIDLPETLDSMPDFLTPTTDKEKQSFFVSFTMPKKLSDQLKADTALQNNEQSNGLVEGTKTNSFLELEQMLNFFYGKEEDVATNYALDQEILNDISLLVEAANGDSLRSPLEDYVDKYSHLPGFNQDDDEKQQNRYQNSFYGRTGTFYTNGLSLLELDGFNQVHQKLPVIVEDERITPIHSDTNPNDPLFFVDNHPESLDITEATLLEPEQLGSKSSSPRFSNCTENVGSPQTQQLWEADWFNEASENRLDRETVEREYNV